MGEDSENKLKKEIVENEWMVSKIWSSSNTTNKKYLLCNNRSDLVSPTMRSTVIAHR